MAPLVCVYLWSLSVGEQSLSAREEEGSDVNLPKTAAGETKALHSEHVRGQEPDRGRTPQERLSGNVCEGKWRRHDSGLELKIIEDIQLKRRGPGEIN